MAAAHLRWHPIRTASPSDRQRTLPTRSRAGYLCCCRYGVMRSRGRLEHEVVSDVSVFHEPVPFSEHVAHGSLDLLSEEHAHRLAFCCRLDLFNRRGIIGHFNDLGRQRLHLRLQGDRSLTSRCDRPCGHKSTSEGLLPGRALWLTSSM